MSDEKVRHNAIGIDFGGAGFIGSNWANWLLEHTDASVHVFDNLSRNGVRYNLDSLNEWPAIRED